MTETRKAVIDRNDIAALVGGGIFLAGGVLMNIVEPLLGLAFVLIVIGTLVMLTAWRRA